MRIPCPLCGERGLEEFSYLGDATLVRPGDDAPLADWVDYVYIRENPAGPHKELWYHAGGCHSWLVVHRDLRDHRVLGAETARSVAAARGPGAIGSQNQPTEEVRQ